jgi:hypothetical protein
VTNPAADAQYQQFLAWQASQGKPVEAVPADERPLPHVVDVLKHLVSIAPLASEAVIRDYHEVLEDFREAWDNVLGHSHDREAVKVSGAETPTVPANNG